MFDQTSFERSCLLIAGLFLGGAAAGTLVPRLNSKRFSPERRLDAAMYLALALATAAGLGTMALGGAFLTTCAASSSPLSTACRWTATPWQGFNALAPDFPALTLGLELDPLAALFVLLVGFFTVGVALYSFSWLADNPQCAWVAGFFNLFALSTLAVLLVSNAFWLLLALELSSLSFAYLVLYRGRQGDSPEESRRAVQLYLVISHVSTMFLTGAVIVMAVQVGSFDYERLRGFGSNGEFKDIVFILLVVGLGIRAGITPFHFWVPIVHPQSPTTTHAFSLGVSIKVAVFLLFRFLFQFLTPLAWWWGALLLVVAAVTALVTVFYALLSRDLKRALAYHSVENIGIILAGLGLAVLFASRELSTAPGMATVVGLSMMASLYHVFNHALFKSLLYLCTGSIEKRLHTVEMDELGGILKRYRWTGFAFLIGAVAIAGFPPFNGFISEWLTLQALFAGMGAFQYKPLTLNLLIVLVVSLILLGFAFALTALAFVKIAGETLLGLPRNPNLWQPAEKNESPRAMRLVMVVIALLCFALGIAPILLIPWLAMVPATLGYSAAGVESSWDALVIHIASERDMIYSVNLSMVPLRGLILLPGLATVIALVWRRYKPPRVSAVWSGGERFQPEAMQYTGSAFTFLIWEPLARQARAVASPGDLPAAFQVAFERVVNEPFNALYNALLTQLRQAATWLGDRVQNGDIRAYLVYILGAFILVVLTLLFTLR